MSQQDRFWEQKSLQEMTSTEWESLCDGCGKCCLHKLQDEDTDEILFTSVACRFLNSDACQCDVYADRKTHVPDCLTLTPNALDALQRLPSTCAYRLLDDGQPLPEWHPLVSGDQNSVHDAHISVRGKVISEDLVDEEDIDLYVIDNLS